MVSIPLQIRFYRPPKKSRRRFWTGRDHDILYLVEAEMRSIDEQVLKVTKEIVAKFIEVGRVSPGTFDDTFKNVYRSIKEAVVENAVPEEE